MIRTVRIPKTVSRMGCTPGGGCCDECGGGHSMGATHRNTPMRGLPGIYCDATGCYDTASGFQISGRMGRLGDITCDAYGNCTDSTTGLPVDPSSLVANQSINPATGLEFNAELPISASNPTPTGATTGTTSLSSISPTTLLVVGIGVFALFSLLSGGSGRRR